MDRQIKVQIGAWLLNVAFLFNLLTILWIGFGISQYRHPTYWTALDAFLSLTLTGPIVLCTLLLASGGYVLVKKHAPLSRWQARIYKYLVFFSMAWFLAQLTFCTNIHFLDALKQ